MDVALEGSNDFLTQMIVAIGCACVVFLLFCAILAIPLFRGRKLSKKCACAASRDAVRAIEERERAAFQAKQYDPKTVDTNDLPTASLELARYVRIKEQTR